jgi:hypothetical protein
MQNIASLLDTYMESQLHVGKFNPRELRLSENEGCARRRVMRCLQKEQTHPLTIHDARNFEKGRAGEMWVENILAKALPGGIIREAICLHPYGDPHGEGHIDIEYPTGNLLIEVKTTSEEKAAIGLPISSHVTQMQSYLHFHRDANGNQYNHGGILYLVLRRYGIYPVWYPVNRVPEKGNAIEALMQNLWHNYVLKGIVPYVSQTAHPKAFPCMWESKDGNKTVAHPCEFWGHCWNDGDIDTALTNINIPTETEQAELLQKYETLRSEYSAGEQQQKAIKIAKDELEEQLNDLFDLRNTDKLTAGGIIVSRKYSPGRTSWDIPHALQCGAVTAAALEPFKRIGDGYMRFTVKKE